MQRIQAQADRHESSKAGLVRMSVTQFLEKLETQGNNEQQH